MGKRGPPPKPSALKKRDGTYRKDRAARHEMAAPLAAPDRPDWLDAEGAAEWDSIVPQLLDLGVLARIDRSALADYCAAHSLAVNATKRYKREGIVMKTPFGPKPHPMIKIAKEARAQANTLRAKFGLTPADRTRVGKPETPPGASQSTDNTPLIGPGLRVVKGGGGGGGG